jgi:nicotinamidase-related amidase
MLSLGFVDVQNDFMLPEGKLYVPGAEKIIRRLSYLLSWARSKSEDGEHTLAIFHTCDEHLPEDAEFEVNGGQFPFHCMKNTFGQSVILELSFSHRPFVKRCYDIWDEKYGQPERFQRWLGAVEEKDRIDNVLLAGLVGNICVKACAIGLRKRNIDVSIIEDSVVWMAVDESNNEKICRKELVAWGVKFIPSIDGYQL